MLRKTMIDLGLAALLSATAMSASAASVESGERMEVRLGGVDLNSDLGARVALARIRTAAKLFCGDPAEAMDLRRHAETRACYSHMTYLAVSKLDAPLVTAAYKGAPLRPEIRLARR